MTASPCIPEKRQISLSRVSPDVTLEETEDNTASTPVKCQKTHPSESPVDTPSATRFLELMKPSRILQNGEFLGVQINYESQNIY